MGKINKTPEAWFGLKSPYRDLETSKVVIIPASYEGTVSWKEGTANGPDAILEASPNIELYDFTTKREAYKIGIHGVPPIKMHEEPEGAVQAVKEEVTRHLKSDKYPVTVGGEHSLTAGAAAACLEFHPGLCVLQLDAHADLRDSYEGTAHSHACVMKRVADMGMDFVQVGIRSMSQAERDWLEENQKEVIPASYVMKRDDWIEKTLAPLGKEVYLTLDVDVLDPSIMPATGTPEPGGLDYYHIIDLVLALSASGRKVVGFDVMEMAPIKCLHHASFTAASLIYTMISAFWAGPE